jgi:predicted dehydrogenase
MGVWRSVRNFGSGTLLDWGSHQFDTAQLAVNAPEIYPIEVQGTGDVPVNMLSDVPITFDVDFLYSNGVVVNVKTGGTAIKLIGSKGWVGNESWRGGLKASDDKILRTKYSAEESQHWPRPAGEHRNFLDCVKSREATTYTEDTMHQLHASLHMGDISIRLGGRKMKWDAANDEFIGDAEANAMRDVPAARNWQAEV